MFKLFNQWICPKVQDYQLIQSFYIYLYSFFIVVAGYSHSSLAAMPPSKPNLDPHAQWRTQGKNFN